MYTLSCTYIIIFKTFVPNNVKLISRNIEDMSSAPKSNFLEIKVKLIAEEIFYIEIEMSLR